MGATFKHRFFNCKVCVCPFQPPIFFLIPVVHFSLLALYSVLGTKTKYEISLNEFEKDKKRNILQNDTWSNSHFFL